jgi:hypothetical protein
MNAVYLLLPRLLQGKRWGKETLAGGGLDNRQFNDFAKEGPLTQFFEAPGTVWTPRVLKDGSDSVGALGALNRVFINIGTFSEEWLLHFNALVGGKRVSPIAIADARKNSAYFKATEAQTLDIARFFLKTTGAHRVKDAPEGTRYLSRDEAQMTRGKVAFAENCARCHSSKTVPPPVPGLDPAGCAGKDYLQCWNRYWEWTQTAEFKEKMRQIVLAADFLDDNYLSNEARVPVTLLQTNACSPLATNAIGGNIWDNFSSQSYKDLPSVGDITWYHPYTGEAQTYTMPAGGRGYTRPASLVSLWSTAPYLLNNTVGHFEASPSVEARMRAFQDGIEQMLWPAKREKDELLGDKIPGKIDRTPQPTYLRVAPGYLPDFLQKLPGDALLPKVFGGGGIEIGPIPTGTPVGLLANANLLYEGPDRSQRLQYDGKVADLIIKVVKDMAALPRNATDEQARAVFKNLVDPLLGVSKCPDFIVNRGHLFGTELPDPDKSCPHRVPEDVLRRTDDQALNSNTSRPAPRANTGSAFLDALSDLSTKVIHVERRFDPFIRPMFDAVLRDPIAKLTTALINSKRPNEGLALAEERPIRTRTRGSIRSSRASASRCVLLWKPGGFERGGNTKTHGIVRGEFIVHDGLPPELRHGIYAKPQTFRAWVRFSGPGPYITPDIEDVGFMSISIKLMGVPGPKLMDEEKFTQDMFGVSTPTFVTPDTKANAQLQIESLKNAQLFYFINLHRPHLLDFIMQGLWTKTQSSPFEAPYFSCVPYLLGEGQAMQYSVWPTSKKRTPIPRLPLRPPDDYLRDAMVKSLAEGDVELDIRLQRQTDPHLMPIENNGVLWPEALSPRVSVATLRLPRQTFNSPAQMEFAKRLSYNPWHSIPEHRPLGNQSRARRKMYLELSKLRHTMNNVPHYEPDGSEVFE